MLESGQGLWDASAGAWVRQVGRDLNRSHLLDPVAFELLGDVRGRSILDVGCGEGRFCRMLAERGATATGIDPTASLLETARQRDPATRYEVAMAEDLPFADGSFDDVVTYLTLVDILDYRKALEEMTRVLRPGGRLLILNVAPHCSVANGWVKDAQGVRQYYAMDDYMEERALLCEWAGIRILNYHRPLSAYMETLLGLGLRLRRYLEPVPSAEDAEAYPSLADNLRVPNFHVMLWERE